MIAFPSALSAAWETVLSAESGLHLLSSILSLNFLGLERILGQQSGHTAAENDDHSAPAHARRVLSSASNEALHLLPCYEQRCWL